MSVYAVLKRLTTGNVCDILSERLTDAVGNRGFRNGGLNFFCVLCGYFL